MSKNDQHVVFIAEDVIPKGLYCYDEKGVCPAWGRSAYYPPQENGYCTFLMQGDWENEGVSLLWDQVKECGVNCETDDEGYF